MAKLFGQQLPSLQTKPPGPITAAWIDRLAHVECPAITARRDRRRDTGGTDPVVWKRAKGANVQDVDDNIYVDLTAGFAVASVGHAHPRVVTAIEKQSKELLHGMGDLYPTRQKIELAERLAELLPGELGQTIFGANGSDAIDVAIKTALITTGKDRVLGFQGGYHGMSLGALGVSGYRDEFRNPFASFAGARELRLPYPGQPGSPWEDGDGSRALAEIEWYLTSPAAGGESIAGVIVEPIQGRGGVVEPPAGWLQELRVLCDRHDILLIFDEIYTGFGRTGRWFAAEYEGVCPDIMCVGKSLGGGVPVSACVGTPEVMSGWGRSSGESIHTSTFLGNPLHMAAALETTRVLEDEGLIEVSRGLGAEIKQRLERETSSLQGVGAIRGKGMMIGVPLLDGEGERAAGGGVQAMFELLQQGVMVAPAGTRGDVISISPPFVITREQVNMALEALIYWLVEREETLEDS